MPVSVTREPARPTVASVDLVGLMSREIGPDDRELDGWFEGYAAHHRLRIAADVDLVRTHVNEDSEILEVGSVPLLLLAAMKRLGYRIRGVDVAPERFSGANAAHQLSVAKCDIEREPLPFARASFDAVLFFELFEHLRIDPIFTMEEVARVLKPGGRLLLSTPNLRSLGGIMNFLLRGKAHSCSEGIYEEYAKLRHLGHMGHVREYTLVELRTFLERMGFDVREVIARGRYAPRWKRLATYLFPRLRPFLGIVATRALNP